MQGNLSSYQNYFNLPPELKVKPLALIGFSGLDIVNNAIHKSVWETFINRNEKAAVTYKIISNTHKFPVIKPKRNSYDWYVPKGILKKNWMVKHLNELPAIIVIFYDLDWKDNLWNEKMIECASRVQSLRATLEGRDTRIIVVLIQNDLPIPEDPLAAERAIALCSSCELNSQSLYVLPHGQHLLGYTIRLENAFFEFCQNYYQNLVKNIKQHKEHLNKNSHQYLYVRHQFKMAFLSELKQDVQSAHKHYTLAYNNLLDIRIVDTNALEIRTLAGFISYKICKLMFVLNLPRDAISQFKSHIDKFKNRIGFQELVFEHYAWLSKQLEIFGDIFDDAVKHELPALQTQHPGIYYQQAAEYAIARKKCCQELCSKIIAYPHPDPLDGIERMEFFGQRPWRPGKVSAEPPEPAVEANGIQALQFLENQINHSSIIISLYGLAIAQYKIYKCPRTRRHLVLKMAEECYNSKDFGKALTLFTHMLSDYREEKWWIIISNILEKAIKCAYLTANVQDYMHLAFEILGSLINISLEDKKRIYENLNRILKKQIPYGDPKLPHDILQNAIILWQPVFNVESSVFTLDMTNITSCIETKVKFIKPAFQMDQNIVLEIFVKSTCPFPLIFTDISVRTNSPNICSEFSIKKTDDTSLVFHPNEIKKYIIEFEPNPSDIYKEVQIEWVNIQIGKNSECFVNLKFGNQETQLETTEKKYFQKYGKEFEFQNIKSLYSTIIVPRESKIKVKLDHAPPALLGERYKIDIIITNEELSGIKDLTVKLHSENINIEAQFSLQPSMTLKKLPLLLPTPSTLDQNESITTVIYVKATTLQDCNFSLKITYTLDGSKPITSIKNELISLPVAEPFEITTTYFSMMMQEIHKFYAGEEFGVMPMIQFTSPWPICIENTSIDFLPPIKSVESEEVQSQLGERTFNKEEVGTELFLAISEKSSDQNIVIGEYTVTWKRENGLTAVTQVMLHGYHCDWIPLNLKMTAPAHGYIRTPLIIQYHLINHSSHLVQLDVGMESSDAFIYSGYRQFSVSVLPNSTKTLQYNLYPLVVGSVTLPRIILSIPENSTEGPALRQDQLNQLIDRNIPLQLYVMPQIKGNATLSEMLKGQLTSVSSPTHPLFSLFTKTLNNKMLS